MLPEWNSKHSESGKAKEVVHYYAGQIMLNHGHHGIKDIKAVFMEEAV